MQSNNPVFRRSEAFSGSAQGHQTYAGYGSDPSQWGVGAPGDTGYAPTPQAPSRPMTIDSVVQKTGISLGVVIVTAMATWIMLPDIGTNPSDSAVGTVGAVATFGFLGAFVLSLVNSFKKIVSPPLVIAFAALEGVALGAISLMFNVAFGEGVVQGAVIGTFAAFAGTLTAYKVLNIQVGDKFRKFVVAAVFGMIGLSLMELVLGLFGAQIGLFGVSGLGMVTAVAGLVLGVFMLILDFDFVEQGIRYGAPERESWTAAFAMTVSLVWIYTNLLRILAFFNQE